MWAAGSTLEAAGSPEPYKPRRGGLGNATISTD